MKDPLEQILSTDRRMPPSPGFEVSVMREVRRLAVEPQSLRFPWGRFLPGLAAMILLALTSTVITLTPGSSLAPVFFSTVHWAYASLVGTGLIWLVLGSLLSYGSVQLTLRSLA